LYSILFPVDFCQKLSNFAKNRGEKYCEIFLETSKYTQKYFQSNINLA